MKKRFLHVCKNPNCSKEFAVVRSHLLKDKAGKTRIMVNCPHCGKKQKV